MTFNSASGALTITAGGAAATAGSFTATRTAGATKALAVVNNSAAGWGLYSSGTSPNYFAGNVGIGTTTPTLAPLQVAGVVGQTAAMFGSGNTGVSLIANWPQIAFNSYYNGGYLFMGTGYAGAIVLDQTTGNMSFDLSTASGTAGGAETTSTPFFLGDNGDVGIGTTTPDHTANETTLTVNDHHSNTANINLDVTGTGNIAGWFAAPGAAGFWGPNFNIYSGTGYFGIDGSGNLSINTLYGGGSDSISLYGPSSNGQTATLNLLDTSNYIQGTFNGDMIVRSYNGIELQTNHSATTGVFIATSGSVGINNTSPSYTLDVNGQIHVGTLAAASATSICRNGNVLSSCSSSIRYKENVKDAPFGLKDVMKMRPVTFKWKGRDENDLGFIAEEMEKVNTLFVSYEHGKIEGVKYPQLTSVLANAIKEQQAEIEQQRAEVKQQQAEIEELRAQIESLTKH